MRFASSLFPPFPRQAAQASKILLVAAAFVAALPGASAFDKPLTPFLEQHCYDCHGDGANKGGLDFDTLDRNLDDEATFAKWELIHDRVQSGEMPPKKVTDRPGPDAISKFAAGLAPALSKAHSARKGTVLRRLNRREYENTLNDLFGTALDLESGLPEDGRSHEFDNVGSALGISMTHLQRYLDAAGAAFDEAIARTTEAPEPTIKTGRYSDDRGSEKFIGDAWKKLEDGSIVRFAGGGYPSGMMRTANVRKSGFYKITVTGHTHQSDKQISFSVGGTSFKPGSPKPIFGYFSFASEKPASIELQAYIEEGYMIQIEPYGISDPDRYRRKKDKLDINAYKGPGLAIHSVRLEGPLHEQFPSRGHRLVFDGLDRREIEPGNPEDKKKSWYQPKFAVHSENEAADATQSLVRVATAAFRRPVAATELHSYLKLFQGERAKGSSMEEALRTAVVAIFTSPNFLYLREPPGPLDDHAVAQRLSYFLTRSTPDEELLQLARAGKLAGVEEKNTAATLKAQTERLLHHPHFQRFLTDFTESWLNLREMDFTAPDRDLFPEFDPFLRHSMPLESEAFLRELIESNLPVTNIVKSDFAMLNERLAELYGIPGVAGTTLRKVALPPGTPRGGFLSQASVLKVSANGTNTSPVLRGVWVMERMLGETPSPPPPGVGGVEPDIRGAKTLRELLAKHRDSESCNSCHSKIDPPGFALESFNPIGGYRDYFRSLNPKAPKVELEVEGRRVHYRQGPEVDASGMFADGRTFSNFIEFRDILAQDSDRLANAMTSKLLTFATGREMGFSDREEIQRIVKTSARTGHRLRDLIHLVVSSQIFRTK